MRWDAGSGLYPVEKTAFKRDFCSSCCWQCCITRILQEGKLPSYLGNQLPQFPRVNPCTLPLTVFTPSPAEFALRVPQSWICWEGRRVCSVIFSDTAAAYAALMNRGPLGCLTLSSFPHLSTCTGLVTPQEMNETGSVGSK